MAEHESNIQKIKASIELEEKMQVATEKILSVTTDAQKVTAIGQLDSCNKRLRILRQELDKIVSSSTSNFKDSEFQISENDIDGIIEGTENNASHITHLRKLLEDQLDDDTKKRSALSKIIQKEKHIFNSHSNMSSKDIDVEILATDRSIHKTKEYLDILNSNDQLKIRALVNQLTEKTKKIDSKGHFFNSKQFFKAMDCFVCHESLYHTKNQGMECSCKILIILACKFICHKDCQENIELSCNHQLKIKSVPPLVKSFIKNST